tara:strand:- start:1048 stop:1626 length:579 start_codon:yes stop_codon:yes gene_type:complete
MIKIAVVGDIGSGKSYLAKQFGFPVFDADSEVEKLYKKNRKCYLKLKKKLPTYITSFPIEKNKLSRAIIDNQNNLKKIIKIVHPLVRKRMNVFFKKNKNKKIVVLDIPLLIENKIYKKNYILVFVDAKKKDIKKRLERRPNFNSKVFKKLKKVQLSVEKKRQKSDFIIKNDFKHDSTKKNVKKVLRKILLNA